MYDSYKISALHIWCRKTQKIGKKSQHLGGPKKAFGANEDNLLADLRWIESEASFMNLNHVPCQLSLCRQAACIKNENTSNTRHPESNLSNESNYACIDTVSCRVSVSRFCWFPVHMESTLLPLCPTGNIARLIILYRSVESWSKDWT